MKTIPVNFTLFHEVNTTAQEIIDNYVDYGHEVFLHSQGYSQWWRKFGFAQVDIKSPTEHEVHITQIMLGLLKRRFIQHVTLIPGQGMISVGNNPFGLPLRSEWTLVEKDGPRVEAKAVYSTELPFVFLFLKWPLIFYWSRLRRGVWAEDAAMLERRARFLRLGFRDGGGFPTATVEPGTWVPLPTEVKDGDVLSVGDDEVWITQVGGKQVAVSNICPHKLGPLSKAKRISENCVQCGWHGYEFDLTTGLCINKAAPRLRRYEIKRENGEAWITRMPEGE